MTNLSRTILYACFTILLIGCSATNNLTMSVVEPAPIILSKDVTRIGIINRSLPSESNKVVDNIDKILSAEGMNLDKDGSEAAIVALMDRLGNNENLEEIVIIQDQAHLRKGLGVFPATITWNEIETLCEEYKVDAIFSLAFYDTDTKVSYKPIMVQLPNDLGIKVAVPAHELTLNTLINNGWRVYDPYNKRVADEFLYSDHIVSSGSGINPVKAYEAIIGRKEAVLQYSSFVGSEYAQRLLPYKHRINRNYFVRGTNNFKIAQRRARAGDWQGAAALWEQEIMNPKPKIAGRACFNMAIINEINGDLEAALNWASKSYTDYNNNYALDYLNTLKYRVSQNERLEAQLSR